MFDTGRPSWQNPRVLAILLAVFLAGAVFGALTMRAGLHARMHSSAAFWKNDSLLSYDKLTRELKLTPEQSLQLKTILDDYARYHQDLQAQLDDWKATGKNQILRILDPGQRARFEQLAAEK